MKHLDEVDSKGQRGALMMHDDGRVFRPVEENLYSTERRLADMERTGVDMQVIFNKSQTDKISVKNCTCGSHSNNGSFLTKYKVLSTVPVMFNYWAKAEDNEQVARFLNDHLAAVVRQSPERFLGLGTVPLQSIELAIKELKRCRYDLNLKGIIIGTHVNDISLDDPRFEPFWRAAQEHSMPLLVPF